MRGKVKFSMAIVILIGLIALCIFKPNEVKAGDIQYIAGTSDIGLSRLVWEGKNYIVDDTTGIIYKENDNLTISLYFADKSEDYMYKYVKETNSIEKIKLP